MKDTYKPVKLINPTAVSYLDEYHHFNHGIDGNPLTYFSLKGGVRDGWWMAQFDSKTPLLVTEVHIKGMPHSTKELEYAKIYIGETFFG